MHIPKGRRLWVNKRKKLCFVCFSLCLFSCIASCLFVGHTYILMLLCLIKCMFGWSFALLCNHCSHFYMTVLVYDQVAHMFHIMFTWSQFSCYIIFVLLLLALPWGSNVFCASVSGYWYIYSKFITAPISHDRGRKRERTLCYINYVFDLLIVHDYAFSLSTSLLCHFLDFISLMQFPCFVALVEC